MLNIDGTNMNVKVIGKDDSDIVAIQITDNRPTPAQIKIDLKMLRAPSVNTGNGGANHAVSTISQETGNIIDQLRLILIEILQKFDFKKILKMSEATKETKYESNEVNRIEWYTGYKGRSKYRPRLGNQSTSKLVAFFTPDRYEKVSECY
jgi:hypothetical protein